MKVYRAIKGAFSLHHHDTNVGSETAVEDEVVVVNRACRFKMYLVAVLAVVAFVAWAVDKAWVLPT